MLSNKTFYSYENNMMTEVPNYLLTLFTTLERSAEYTLTVRIFLIVAEEFQIR